MTYETDPKITEKYKILEKLPESGSSQVLVAEHRLTQEKQILKILNVPTKYKSPFDQLRDEFKVLRSLDHPGIAKAYIADQTSDGTPFLVMEYVPGKSVRELTNKDTSLNVNLGLKIMKEVLETLIYLDKQGILHRDIKPEHIILDEKKGRARLVDFGVSRLREESDKTFVGTLPYVAPEIWKGRGWVRNSDLYATGMVFYEMLTNHRPYNGDAITEQNGAPTPRHPCRFNPDIPRPIGDSIIKALASDPEDRFRSASDWLEAILDPLTAAQNPQVQEKKMQTIDRNQQQAILDALEERMKQEPDNDLFDKMLQVQFALKSWDREGKMPGAEQLQNWGIDIATTKPQPSKAPDPASDPAPWSEDDMTHIIQGLRERTRLALGDDQLVMALQETREAIEQWHEDDMMDPLPYADKLATWGIWPPQPTSEDEPPATTADTATVPEPPPTPSSSSSSEDDDQALREQYEATERLYRSGKEQESLYYQAIQKLESLQQQANDASAALQEDIETLLSTAHVALDKATTMAVARARRVARSEPDNLDRQTYAWRKVLTINPQSMEASEALAEIEAQLEQRRQSEALDRILREAEAAATKDNLDLPNLNKLRGEIEVWVERGEAGELSPAIQRKVTALNEKVLGESGLLARVRDKLGIASTFIVTEEFKAAYALAQYYLKVAPKAIDYEGILGPQGKEVSSQALHDEVREQYLTALKKRTHDRLEEIEGLQHTSPEKALKKIEEAEAWLRDEDQEWLGDTEKEDLNLKEIFEEHLDGRVLTNEDMRLLQKEANLVAETREEVESLWEKYQQAEEKITQARTVKSTDQALALLADARTIYPDYPGLDQEYEAARQRRGATFAGNISTAISDAKSLAAKDEFAAAREKLNTVGERASEILPDPAPGSPLIHALDEVQQTLDAIQEQETSYDQMQAILKDIEATLTRYEESKASKELRQARASLESLPEERKEHPDVVTIRSKLTSLQGNDENWQEGQREYHRKNWETALEYFDKITEDFPKYQQLKDLRARARAAQTVIEAQQAEKKREWKEALQHYKTAVGYFDGWDSEHEKPVAVKKWNTDILTRPMAEQCHQALQKLALLAENDRRVSKILNDAKTLLKNAQLRLEAIEETGGGLINRIDPIPQFPRAVELLEKLQQEDTQTTGIDDVGSNAMGLMTTLSKEITKELARAREAWRAAYVKVFEMAQATNDLGAMGKALERGKELSQANLLYKHEDKEAYSKLACAYYDLHYEELMAQPAKNWLIIKENRQKRLQVAGVSHPDEVQAQLSEAEEKHIDDAIEKKHREDGPEAARDYLHQQMATSDAIRSNPNFIRKLIELCWETQDWGKAKSVARRFGHNNVKDGKIQAEIWLELTEMAQSFAEDQIKIGQSRIRTLREQFPLYEDLIAKKERQCLTVTLKRLLREGRSLIAIKPLKATGKYARALEIAKQNELHREYGEAKASLNQIGENLGQEVEDLCKDAFALKIDERNSKKDFEEAMNSGRDLTTKLSPIQKVAEFLQLGSELEAKIESALSQLEDNLEIWQDIYTKLEDSETALMEALAEPLPLDYNDGNGGWNFQKVWGYLDEARQTAGRDNKLIKLVKDRRRQVDDYESNADMLLEIIHPLMVAVRNENFDTVIHKSQELKQEWRRVQNTDPGWAGIQTLLQHHYPLLDRDAQKAEDHQQIAKKQARNLKVWQRHADNVQDIYDQLREIEAELDGNLDKLKQKRSLKEIIDQCTLWLSHSEEFLEIAKKELPAPQSEKATEAQRSIKAGDRIAEIEGEHGNHARITDLRAIAETTLEEFEDRKEGAPLFELQNFVSMIKRLPSIRKKHIETAREKLQVCEEIDPWHEKVLSYKEVLDELEEQVTEGPAKKQRGWGPFR